MIAMIVWGFVFLMMGILLARSAVLKELKRQKKRLENIIEGTNAGTWEWNVQTGETVFNERWADIIGYTLEELQPVSIETWLSHTHPEDLEKSNAALEDHFNGKSGHYKMECRMKHKAGHWVWVIDKGKVISWNEAGKPLWMYGTHQDITDRVHAEKRLQRIQDLSDSIQRLGKIGAWEYDISSQKGFWTKEIYRQHDIEPGSDNPDLYPLVEKSMSYYRPRDRQMILYAFRQCVQDGTPYTLEFLFTTPKGRRTWIQTSAKRVTGEKGHQRVIGYLMDITHRKQNEQARGQEEKKYRTILQTTVNGFWLTNLRGRILEVNTAYCQMSGHSEKELLSMYVSELEGDMGPDELLKKFKAIMHKGHDRFETRHRRKDGDLYHVEVSAQYLAIEDGRLVIFVRDISKNKEARAYNEQLRCQLNQAQKMESVGRLAGGVAHDLNNLLVPILGYGEMLLRDIETDHDRRRKIKSILKAGNGAKSLVRQLLAFSRKQPLEFRCVDVDQCLFDFEKLLCRTIREDIDLNIIPSAGVKTIMADRGQLEQIFMNLSVNAADAMPNGGTLMIETGFTRLDASYVLKHPGTLPGLYVQISFSDTGQGMDYQTLNKIFDPFFSTKGEQGTGLGLATVYGIVKQHKGNIWVYSEMDKGSVFKIYFPFAPGTDTQSVIEKKGIADLTGTETILLAEDNEAARENIAEVLDQSGYTVLTAENGHEAQQVHASHGGPVDLLITDVIMPEMNGKELYTALHRLDGNIKVLYMSGYANTIIAHHGILDRDVQYIQKPFNQEDFLSKIRHVLNQKSGGAETQTK